jgi:hypothetical protein
MSIFTTVTVTRGAANTLVASHVACQIDNMNDDVMTDHHGEVPADYFRWISNPGYVPAVLQGDTLTDEINATVYRVRGQVEFFGKHHVEAKISHPRMS